MKRVWLPLLSVALSAWLFVPAVRAQTCNIGGHNETSENFAPGGWGLSPGNPGMVIGAPTASHLVISEVAPRGFGTGALSDSSEYIEIYNPTPRPIRLDNKYVADEIGYYRVVNGPFPAANATDFVLRFPTGLILSPGRTLVLCATKVGFAASGAAPGLAQYFLEMRDSNANPLDDMILLTTGTTIPLSGGMLTNPAVTNGEWVVLFCWNGAADLVCDIDYASWGATSAANPKMNKSGVNIDGPDAGGAVSSYNADTAAILQTNLGSSSVLAKPNTYQRIGGEVGETTVGGNGCTGRVAPTGIAWLPIAGTQNIRFHMRWTNQDDDAESTPVNGTMNSQEFGVFLPDYGSIGSFNVPPLAPSSFFDVFIDIPLSALPPPPEKHLPGGGPAPSGELGPLGSSSTATTNCPPDTNWAGNVDIFWSGSGQGGQVNRHYGDLLTCRGGPPSYIHFRPSNCAAPMPWGLAGVCPGYSVTLVNENFTPAPNPVPVGWSGWICVSTAAAVPLGTTCCFSVNFGCAGETATIDICSVACDWQDINPPTLSTVDWVNIGTTVRFHLGWQNTNPSLPSDPINGNLNSQEFGVFLADFGSIGSFGVPPLPPNSFFDVFIDIPLSQLPPEPPMQLPGGGPPANGPCPPPTAWHGNVDVSWIGPGSSGQVNRHFGELPVCPGAGPSYIHLVTGCTIATGLNWSIGGLCPGFNATLVNEDFTPAPNPLPPGWSGWICAASPPATPLGLLCCFTVDFLCGTDPARIEVCARTCNWENHGPTLVGLDWTTVGTLERFHLRWQNQGGGTSDPIQGSMMSQMFGVFLPNAGTIGNFNVPPMAPSSFFDVFLDIPLASLPPQPPIQLPGGGPGPNGPCPPPSAWRGNVDVVWGGPGGTGQVNKHFSELPICPGPDPSYIHLITGCPVGSSLQWAINGLCPGFNATLVNEDHSPAPAVLPAGWTGWICVSHPAAVPNGTTCCFTVDLLCGTEPGSIDMCVTTCDWSVSGVPPVPPGVDFGIFLTSPNPTRNGMSIGFVLPASGRARIDVFNITGQLVRSLFDGEANAGANRLAWDGRSDNGGTLAPGVYFLTLKSNDRSASRKVLLTP